MSSSSRLTDSSRSTSATHRTRLVLRYRMSAMGLRVTIAEYRFGSVAAIAWGQLGVVANDWCRAVGWAALNP